jgi:hypothetical protein
MNAISSNTIIDLRDFSNVPYEDNYHQYAVEVARLSDKFYKYQLKIQRLYQMKANDLTPEMLHEKANQYDTTLQILADRIRFLRELYQLEHDLMTLLQKPRLYCMSHYCFHYRMELRDYVRLKNIHNQYMNYVRK